MVTAFRCCPNVSAASKSPNLPLNSFFTFLGISLTYIADESVAWGSNFWLIGGEGTNILYQATQTYKLNAFALSTSIARTEGLITKATLGANDVLNNGTIDYYLSADGGSTWQHASEVVFDNPGYDLRWKAELLTSDDTQSPKINSVIITYTIEEELPYTGK